MKITWAAGLVLLLVSNANAQFAQSVSHYEPGAGAAAGYDNPLTALGEPSRFNPGMFGGPVDPFSPPFLPDQLVSIGAGGSLTVAFHHPLEENPSHPFGMEFIVYGNNGFSITNGDFGGGGITDGSTFTFDPPGASRVLVSEDGQTFYPLYPPAGVAVDNLFPTDAQGDFSRPVDPSLTNHSFAGLGLPGIRNLYGDSGGGTGFDLAWATNSNGDPISRARFVRIEVLSGKVEVDGIAAVNPNSASLVEHFSSDPALRGWQRYGAGELFDWDEVTGRLRVTWDSSQTNSYFHKPLGQILSKADDFALAFDLELDSIAIGTTPGKPYTFQLALGLMNWAEATRPDFFRGSGIHAQFGARSLVEFNYFPDSGFGATVAPTVVSTNNQIGFGGTFPLAMTTGDVFRVEMVYRASNQVLRASMTRNGEPFGLPPDQTLRELSLASLPDFRVDTLAVASYSDGGQSPPEYAGSILAQGTVDNLRVELPPAPVREMVGGYDEEGWTLSFVSRLGYLYQLERSMNLADWESASEQVEGTGDAMTLEDQSAPVEHFFYRVRVFKP